MIPTTRILVNASTIFLSVWNAAVGPRWIAIPMAVCFAIAAHGLVAGIKGYSA